MPTVARNARHFSRLLGAHLHTVARTRHVRGLLGATTAVVPRRGIGMCGVWPADTWTAVVCVQSWHQTSKRFDFSRTRFDSDSTRFDLSCTSRCNDEAIGVCGRLTLCLRRVCSMLAFYKQNDFAYFVLKVLKFRSERNQTELNIESFNKVKFLLTIIISV